MTIEQLKPICDKIGHERVIKHLKHIKHHLDALGLENNLETNIKELEKDWSDDFWSGWVDYVPNKKQ